MLKLGLRVNHRRMQQSRARGGVGEVDEDVGALVGLGLDFDFAAVLADDAADDEHLNRRLMIGLQP
jgi:hypothetical protein